MLRRRSATAIAFLWVFQVLNRLYAHLIFFLVLSAKLEKKEILMWNFYLMRYFYHCTVHIIQLIFGFQFEGVVHFFFVWYNILADKRNKIQDTNLNPNL